MAALEFDSFGFVRVIAFAIAFLLIYITRPEGFSQWCSSLLVRFRLMLHRRRKKPRFPPYNLKDSSLYELGVLPRAIEYEQENPQPALEDKHCDGVHFIGVDAEQNFLDVAITNISDELSNMWIVLKLSDGCTYELPNQPDTRYCYIRSSSGFTVGGLQIRCHSPLRRWRISYNGLLRKTKNSNGESQTELVHVKFSFIWVSVTLIHDLSTQYDLRSLAKAIAEENPYAENKHFARFEEINNTYEQWGQLMGTVLEQGSSEKELYLWSMRVRHLENPCWESDLNFVKLFLYFKDGTPIKVEFSSLKGLMSEYFSGYTVSAGGKENRIYTNTLRMQQLSSRKSPSRIYFTFTEDSRSHSVDIHATDFKFSLLLGHRNERTLDCSYVKATLDNEEEGYGVIIKGHKSTSNISSALVKPIIILKEESYLPRNIGRVVSLENKLCKNSSVSGGKGCSLALLTDLSKKSSLFRVPKGFVITTAAFEEHVVNNRHLVVAERELANFNSNKDIDLKEACEKCSKEFERTELSSQLKSEIAAAFESLKVDSNVKFAIRSSAVGEDGEDSSAAGQMLTVLGVKGLENIYKAIAMCWSSRFRYEAVQYSRQRGQLPNTAMAVVVQEMVLADSAGVMFTVDPVTGNPMYPCITANFGLGESVVSSAVDPDTYILKRSKDDSITVYDTKIGSKESKIIVLDDGGTVEEPVKAGFWMPCLSDEMAIRIGKAGILVEKCFCGPRDIEWAVRDGDFYLLQARPITTIHSETDFEAARELDTPVRSSYEYWTRANTGEVFCGACSPLGLSVVVLGMDVFGQRNFIVRQRPKNFDFVPYFSHWLPSSHRQVMLSLIDTLFRTNEKEITTAQKSFEIALFGRTIATEHMHRWGIKKFGYISRKQKAFSMVSLVYFSYRIPAKIEEIRKKVWDFRVPLESFKTPFEVYESIEKQMQFYGEASGIHGLATYLSSFYNVLMLTLLGRGKKVWDNELYSDFATLLSTCNDVESADVPASLQDLAKAIYETDPSTFSSVSVEVARSFLEKDKGSAGQKFKEFLQKHGHRCLKEFDVYSISWGMKPESLVQVLQNMVASPVILSKEKPKTSIDEAIEKLKSPLSRSSKFLLKMLLPWSRRAVGHREKTKSMVIKHVDWLRRSCRCLGEMLERDGYLPSSELLFFLTLDEIKVLMETRDMNLISRATRRRRIHPKLDSLKFPEITAGIPKPMSEESEDLEQYPSTFQLEGTPVCPGIVKARARVVPSLEKASEIKQGEVLVAYSTDIGWSPYFPLLSGVITVLGGLISHGAVVAREYGLPCVVGVQKATSLLKTGDLIVLDGSSGKIIKIDESENQNS